MTISPNERLLFQGDSITDAQRKRNGDQDPEIMGQSLGCGYASIIASQLAHDLAEGPIWLGNLGLSGNRIVDLAARAQEHIWNLEPSMLSILIGVNDTWHHFSRQSGVDLPRFARCYRELLNDSRQRLPQLRLVLCEPFTLPCGVVTAAWEEQMKQRQQIVADLAKDFDAVFVPFQAAFDQACQRAPASYWAKDGVHPSPAGHYLMARTWLQAVGYSQL